MARMVGPATPVTVFAAGIRRGVTADAEPLSRFMAASFVDAFGDLNEPAHLQAFLAASYNPARQRQELVDPAIVTLLAEIDGGMAGYAQVRAGNYLPPCVSGPAPIELWRFYVGSTWIGRGVARPLMDAAKAEARARGGQTLWLGVWEINARAIAFYRKAGFTEVGTHHFDVGGDRQTDLVMAGSLASP